MQDLTFRTFAEYVDVIGRNAPHALVLDWWRRLDLALLDYVQSLGEYRPVIRNEEETRSRTIRSLGLEPGRLFHNSGVSATRSHTRRSCSLPQTPPRSLRLHCT